MHSVALMVYPNFQYLSLSLGSVFERANLLRGEPAYEFHMVSESGRTEMTSQSSSVKTTAIRPHGYDTLIVSGCLQFRLSEANLL